MSPAGKWAIGLGVVAAAAGGAWWYYKRGPGAPGGGGGGGAITPSPSSGGGSTGAPPNVQITVADGNNDVQLVPGTVVTLALPEGMTWTIAPTSNGSISMGSAPSSGSNPAGFTYDGGTQDAGGYGGHVFLSYQDGAGNGHIATLNISDA